MAHFLKLHIDVYLRGKFQTSSIILTDFTPPPPLPKNEPLKSHPD